MNGPNNRIGSCSHTWNPVTGCLNNCAYCYARRLASRFKLSFKPQLHAHRIWEPLKLKTPAKIFVCSCAELFGPWIPEQWIRQVLEVTHHAPWHTFQFLSKFPERMVEYDFPMNCWLGVTVTKQEDTARLNLLTRRANLRFVSFEPLTGRVELPEKAWASLGWLIIGPLSLPGGRYIQPESQWVESILEKADEHSIPVYMKRKLIPPLNSERREEFPKEEHGRAGFGPDSAGRDERADRAQPGSRPDQERAEPSARSVRE